MARVQAQPSSRREVHISPRHPQSLATSNHHVPPSARRLRIRSRTILSATRGDLSRLLSSSHFLSLSLQRVPLHYATLTPVVAHLLTLCITATPANKVARHPQVRRADGSSSKRLHPSRRSQSLNRSRRRSSLPNPCAKARSNACSRMSRRPRARSRARTSTTAGTRRTRAPTLAARSAALRPCRSIRTSLQLSHLFTMTFRRSRRTCW